MKRLKRAGHWYWQHSHPMWIVWMFVFLLLNAPGWVDHWWYAPAMLFYVGIMVMHAFNWGQARANATWHRIAEDQLKLLKQMSEETVTLPFVAVTAAPPDTDKLIELQKVVTIRFPLSMN